MSYRSGNNQKRGQKYQNSTEFKIRKYNQQGLRNIQNAPMDHLCERCYEQIQWKLKYSKYHRMNNVARCNKCENKVIFKSYRQVCDPCATNAKICAKCMDPVEKYHELEEKQGVEKDLLEVMETYMKTLRERSRRKLLRLIKQKQITWSRVLGCFIYKQDGKQVEDLHYRNVIDEFGDFQEEEEEKDDQGEEDIDLKDENQILRHMDENTQDQDRDENEQKPAAEQKEDQEDSESEEDH